MITWYIHGLQLLLFRISVVSVYSTLDKKSNDPALQPISVVSVFVEIPKKLFRWLWKTDFKYGYFHFFFLKFN